MLHPFGLFFKQKHFAIKKLRQNVKNSRNLVFMKKRIQDHICEPREDANKGLSFIQYFFN